MYVSTGTIHDQKCVLKKEEEERKRRRKKKELLAVLGVCRQTLVMGNWVGKCCTAQKRIW